MKNFKPVDLICFAPFLFFILFTFPYLGESPSLDPMVNYRHSVQFYSSGVSEILRDGATVHPPLLYMLTSASFFLFGKGPLSYTLAGIIVYLISSVFLYLSIKDIFGRKVAILSETLLFLNPFIVVNFFYPTSEALILAGLIFSITFYTHHKLIPLMLSLMMLALMKETTLAIIVALFFLMAFRAILPKAKWTGILEVVLTFTPAIAASLVWGWYLQLLGTTEWRDTIFVQGGEGSFTTVLKNILTLKIFNQFLLGNLYNAFILHFQWVYTALLLILFILPHTKYLLQEAQKKYFNAVLATAVFYILLVFSFPTWTVNRYTIPINLSLFFLISLLLSNLKWQKLFFIFLPALVIPLLIGNLYSLDPANSSKGFITISGEKFYNTEFWNNGPDRIIYNTQFLRATANQNRLIKDVLAQGPDVLVTYCDELKLGEKIWSISVHNEFYPDLKLEKPLECINNYELEKQETNTKLQGKIILWR